MHELTTKLTSTSVGGAGEALCFDKNEFMKANFSVDEFLHKNRHAPSLEQLRDNLGLYLKDLRASMIDLINEDYADFVSLSANLVGLDQSIETIQRPLMKFRADIESIESLIQDNETEVRAQLEKKRALRELRRNMQSLKKVYEAIQKLDDILTNRLSEHLHPVDLERAALELIQLKFNEKFCLAYLKDEQKQKIEKLEQEVHQKMRNLFNICLKEATANCSEKLERCLRIYATLDACNIAEKAFREDVVGPYMSDIISEHSLQNSPQGLAGIYSKILNFISLHMTDLLRLTQYTDKLSGFNFLINSFWSDVEMRLETHMTSIFAPGNSDVFYAKYKCTREFLTKIEELLANDTAVKAFRQHKQRTSFQARWNLPVYFQICFQEIAGQFEATLEPILSDEILQKSATQTDDYQLSAFNSANKAIKRCWSDGVYLSEVFPKFYKLNVQIITRLSRWISDFLHAINTPSSTNVTTKLHQTKLLVALHQDIRKFIATFPQQLQDIIAKLPVEQQQNPNISKTLTNSYLDLEEALSLHVNTIERTLIELLIKESGSDNIRQVNDLPRLYRKTNRDIPTRCSTYVEQMLRPIKNFAEEQRTRLDSTKVKNILKEVCSKITIDYYTAVNDVLTSVQKTEESLRRLRNLKSGANTMTTSMSSSSVSNTVTDDDKIRLQLRVDVITWTNELAKMSFMPTDITKLHELNNMVEESVKLKDLNITGL